jgi:hypothetical protein
MSGAAGEVGDCVQPGVVRGGHDRAAAAVGERLDGRWGSRFRRRSAAGLRVDVDVCVGGRGRDAVVGQPGYPPHHVLVAIEADCGGGGGGGGQGLHSERGGARRSALMRRANVQGGLRAPA